MATQKDAENTNTILDKAGYEAFQCESSSLLEREILAGVGALIVAKEVLTPETTAHLSKLISRQPSWSFLPIIVLLSPGDLGSDETLRLLKPLKNTTLLERPVRVNTLVSVVQAALADRHRQFEVSLLVEALEKSEQAAIAANEAKTAFLANMSHEIRTPLGAVLGYAELITEPTVSEVEKKSFINAIKRNGQLLSALIDDILDLAKVESGHLDIESVEVPVVELISEVVSALEPKAQAKNIPLIITRDSNVPNIIKTDSNRIKQVLVNIIGNAIKFTNEGMIRIRLYASESEGQKLLNFEVKDSGVGISVEQASKLFQPFAQADSSITRKFGGTGLGLVLSQKISKLLGGGISLKESIIGKGSTFEISVALHEVETQKPMEAPLNLKNILVNSRILVVDDSRDNQVLITRMLNLAGAEVQVASNGLEAIDKATHEIFDVVLMDIQMPQLGGYEATLRLRKSGYTKPIIALTAHALKEDRDRCMLAGCNDYLTKPIQRKSLLTAVASHLP